MNYPHGKRFGVYIKHDDNTGAWLSHKGRTEWSYRTARRHLRDVVREHVADSLKWQAVRYFAVVEV